MATPSPASSSTSTQSFTATPNNDPLQPDHSSASSPATPNIPYPRLHAFLSKGRKAAARSTATSVNSHLQSQLHDQSQTSLPSCQTNLLQSRKSSARKNLLRHNASTHSCRQPNWAARTFPALRKSPTLRSGSDRVLAFQSEGAPAQHPHTATQETQDAHGTETEAIARPKRFVKLKNCYKLFRIKKKQLIDPMPAVNKHTKDDPTPPSPVSIDSHPEDKSMPAAKTKLSSKVETNRASATPQTRGQRVQYKSDLKVRPQRLNHTLFNDREMASAFHTDRPASSASLWNETFGKGKHHFRSKSMQTIRTSPTPEDGSESPWGVKNDSVDLERNVSYSSRSSRKSDLASIVSAFKSKSPLKQDNDAGELAMQPSATQEDSSDTFTVSPVALQDDAFVNYTLHSMRKGNKTFLSKVKALNLGIRK